MALREQTKVTYVLDEDAMREIVEEEGLTGDVAEAAIQKILSEAGEICLASLARHVFEATNVDLSDFEEDDEPMTDEEFRAAHWDDTVF
jgi:hypothetical protein